MSRPGGDVMLGTALALVGLGALYVLTGIETTSLAAREALSSKTLPAIYAGLLFALSALMATGGMIRWVWQRHTAASEEYRPTSLPVTWQSVVRVGGTFAVLVGYVLALGWLPFFLATTLFFVAAFILYGRKPLWRVLLVSVIAAGAFHWLFIEVIKLPL